MTTKTIDEKKVEIEHNFNKVISMLDMFISENHTKTYVVIKIIERWLQAIKPQVVEQISKDRAKEMDMFFDKYIVSSEASK